MVNDRPEKKSWQQWVFHEALRKPAWASPTFPRLTDECHYLPWLAVNDLRINNNSIGLNNNCQQTQPLCSEPAAVWCTHTAIHKQLVFVKPSHSSKFSRLGYFRFGWYPKVNSWAQLWYNFYRLDAFPVAQPTASKHWRITVSLTYLGSTTSREHHSCDNNLESACCHHAVMVNQEHTVVAGLLQVGCPSSHTTTASK